MTHFISTDTLTIHSAETEARSRCSCRWTSQWPHSRRRAGKVSGAYLREVSALALRPKPFPIAALIGRPFDACLRCRRPPIRHPQGIR